MPGRDRKAPARDQGSWWSDARRPRTRCVCRPASLGATCSKARRGRLLDQGLKNLHIIDPLAPMWAFLLLPGRLGRRDLIGIGPPPAGWTFGLLLPKDAQAGLKVEGMKAGKLTAKQV